MRLVSAMSTVKYASEPSTRSSATAVTSRRGGLRTAIVAHAASSRTRAPSARHRGRQRSRARSTTGSGVEAEMHDVSVADDVLAAFEPHPARLLRALLAVVRDIVVVCDHLRADEAALEIGVD